MKWTAIVDAHDHRASIAQRRHTHVAWNGERGVRRVMAYMSYTSPSTCAGRDSASVPRSEAGACTERPRSSACRPVPVPCTAGRRYLIGSRRGAASESLSRSAGDSHRDHRRDSSRPASCGCCGIRRSRRRACFRPAVMGTSFVLYWIGVPAQAASARMLRRCTQFRNTLTPDASRFTIARSPSRPHVFTRRLCVWMLMRMPCEQERHRGSAAVADQRSGTPHHGENAAHHAHVDEGVGEEVSVTGASQQAREQCRGVGGMVEPRPITSRNRMSRISLPNSPNSSSTRRRMKSVVRSGRNRGGPGCRSASLAEHAAGAQRDGGLDGVIARPAVWSGSISVSTHWR